ncbi:MAG: FAD-dependent oxidoreductase [Lachnospiraceae bacterium]
MQNQERLYDVVIVGAGPAGLSAAIYMARAKYKVLVLEKEAIGGQITITSEIVNYPGVEETSGKELTDTMRVQAESFGADFAIAEVLNMDLQKEIKEINTTQGVYQALGVVLAVGANPRKLGFKGEKEYQGRGVAYCATCDGEFFTGKDVFVVGGGFAAVEEGIFLTKYASHVTMIVRGEAFTCAQTVADEVQKHEKIDVKFFTELKEVSGSPMVNYARFYNNQTGEEWIHENDKGFGVFVFAGYVPNTIWLPDIIEKNEQGYLLTDVNQKTNLDGVYGAGDVCVKNLRQVVTAVSDGATAATSLEKYVSELHGRLKLPELEIKKKESVRKVQKKESETAVSGGGFLTAEIKQQLSGVFAKFEHNVVIKAWLDDSPLSGELGGFLGELESLTDKVSWITASSEDGTPPEHLPSLELCREDGSSSGIHFHGVPGGHEFNSFVIALYNVAGPGQAIAPEITAALDQLDQDVNVKILISLSCTMCPEVVMAVQRTAALSPHIQAEMFDLMHFPALKEKYQVMSVPCMVINDTKIHFGKKNLQEVVEIIQNSAR